MGVDESLILAAQMTELLDNAPIAVIVRALDNRELLYVNHTARSLISQKVGGIKAVLQAYDSAGAASEELSPSFKTTVRELFIPAGRQTLQLSSIIAEWNNKPAQFVYMQDITEKKQTEEKLATLQQKMEAIITAIPGGDAVYRLEGERLIATFLSDGAIRLTGCTREEYEALIENDAMDLIYKPDRKRVLAAAKSMAKGCSSMDVSFRIRNKDGCLIWLHINGRRLEARADYIEIYVVFTGMSAETRLFQNIAMETADGIYVIDRENYELLYANESKNLFLKETDYVGGQKCYALLHGKKSPCSLCTMKSHSPEGAEHELIVDGVKHFYNTRFRKTDWNGIPAYVKYVRDITDEIQLRKEKERLEQYFQTVIRNLPGGIAVVHYDKAGHVVPEYLSDGFAAMTNMSLEDAWHLYRQDAMCGVHPDDREYVSEQMMAYVFSGASRCEIVYRLKKGGGGYVWVKNSLSMIQNEGGESRVYAVYNDMTKERDEQERIRQQYKAIILKHYRSPEPNALVIGHCDITTNQIFEIIDHTGSNLLETFGTVRDDFFKGIAGYIVDEKERHTFLNTFLSTPAYAAYQRNDLVRILKCFIKFPQEERGRYVQFKVNLVETPDTGGVTGILVVTDITEQTISDRILHQLSVTSYDFVIDLDLKKDTFTVLEGKKDTDYLPDAKGSHSQRMAYMLPLILPKDREQYSCSLKPEEIYRRLQEAGTYTFAYSLTDEKGDIRSKNLTVSAVDLRLERVCLIRADITDSVREQQGLLNMMAYTFELVGFIDLNSRRLTMHTRKTVLENLSPYIVEDYNCAARHFADFYCVEEDDAYNQFLLGTLLEKLGEKSATAGYDFVIPYRSQEGLRYKQINVMWGDENHRTVCLVRADVTEMLTAERKTKKVLEDTLARAEEANRAKSDFLSAMSHDIRTPMNAIMGMTALACAQIEDQERVADCLRKIAISSKHLLSLINNILDMSRIERCKVTLNDIRISLFELLEQLSAIAAPQAKDAGLRFDIRTKGISHTYFYGDALRINQILINILGNAIKFTPKGGVVDFLVEELDPVWDSQNIRYRFTVSDTGMGISKESLAHIFEPFTRSATRIEGTGLGLSITKGLVDLMQGAIYVESSLNKGSKFRVELEFKALQSEEAAIVEEDEKVELCIDKTTFAGRCFLVVEDNAINAEILCRFLEMYGAFSVVKTNGRQAVQAFKDAAPGTYDAVLMDIQMPEMNGYEATRAIRRMKRADAGTIPIVAMTANAFAEDIQKSLEAGMAAHVAKPIDVDLLWLTLSRVLTEKKNGL